MLEAGADASIATANGQTVIDRVSGRGQRGGGGLASFGGGRGCGAPANEAALALLAEFGYTAE